MTAWKQEQIKCANKIAEYKLASEANVVASIYKNPELIYDLDLKLEDISNNTWRVFFAIAYGLILNENKTVLDEITIGTYLDKHLKLKAKVDDYGGFSTIQDAMSYINLDNFDGYVSDIKKFNVLLELLKYGFPISEKLSEYVDKSLDDIYEELEMFLNHIFVSADRGVESYNICEGMEEYIQSLNKCEEVGMPLYGSTLLNDLVSGIHIGNIMGIGASSGVGKTWLTFQYIVPSAIKYNERVVILCNEESERRYRLELLTFVVNNVFNHELQKIQLRNGNFSKEVMEWLREAKEYLEEKANEHLITIVPLQFYNVDLAIKIIKKYSSAFGVKLFVIDTLKESNNASSDDMFKTMMRDVLKLYDVIKPSNRNLALILTYQLNKQSLKVRHLTNNEIGWSKGILDVMSSNILVRKPNTDEYGGGSKQLQCYRLENKTKIPFTLEQGEHYLIIFLSKNRHGETDPYQIIAKINQSTNQYEEIGICYVAEDW